MTRLLKPKNKIMEKEEIKQKGDEILEVLEKALIKHIQSLLKISASIEVSEKDAEVMLAKIGKKLLLKVLSSLQ